MDYSRVVFEAAGEASATASPGYAFVGLYARGDKLIFRLPLGYPVPDTLFAYEAARDLHIIFFKLFQRFRAIAERNQERQKDNSATHEDAGAALAGGRQWIVRHAEGDVYYYRHFDAFDSLLEAFDELALLSLRRRLCLTDSTPSDLRHFERTDAGRIYQSDDSFFDDVTFQPAATLTLLASDLVGLYCFLLRDLREHVWGEHDPDPLQHDVHVIAEQFEVKHLWPSASCWEADEWQRTRDTLRDKLDVIDQVTSLKDEDYHQLYDAVTRFLYPPADAPHGDGILWGIDGFWPVWEWMVLSRLATAKAFKDRLCWIETGNLAPGTVEELRHAGYRYPLHDERVMCETGSDWDAFLEAGRRLGNPYPDAILRQVAVEEESTPHNGLRWIEALRLVEGEVTMTLKGMHQYLAMPLTPPNLLHYRTNEPPEPAVVDEEKLNPPVLQLTGMAEPDIDRPEVPAMLRQLGEWPPGLGAFWRYAPFKSCRDATRQRLSGLLLVDAKYKAAQDKGAIWAADHRKQAAYEDALTLACPNTPAAYSIYICPSTAASAEPMSALLARRSALKAQFDHEFASAWRDLPDREAYGGTYKQGNLSLTVLGCKTKVEYGANQQAVAQRDLEGKVLGPVRAAIAERHLSRSLLGVDRFPDNDQFFIKHWPIQDLVDEIVHDQPRTPVSTGAVVPEYLR